jgi:lysophospholipid acyltransferase (LPLAT)-like uncharacterized protein
MGRKKPWWRRRMSPSRLRWFSFFSWLGINLLCKTLRYRYVGDDRLPANKKSILLCWHGQQLLGFYFYRNRKIAILSSLSKDGDFSSSILRRFGWKIIRGSSNRRAAASLIELIRYLREEGTVAITPDGPSGPIYHIEPGAIYMSQKTGAPIYPIGFVPERYWEFNTWDRFIVPKPFSRCIIYCGEPLFVPKGIDESQFEEWKDTIAAALHRANALGREELERWCQSR